MYTILRHSQRLAYSRLQTRSVSSFARMKVIPVPVRTDNYAYLLIDDATGQAAAIDPYDVSKIQKAIERLSQQINIIAGITTHHHQDHSGGNEKFREIYPDAVIYGGSEEVQACTNIVKDKDEFFIGGIRVRCLATPCHTRDSICYYVTDTSNASQPGGVFTGDTLFVGGNGRFFEGTGEQMHSALTYLRTLPDETVTYVGHEYTAGNVAFGKSVDPGNKALGRLAELVKENEITTGLSTIGDEKEWNVFMRLETDALKTATKASVNTPIGTIMSTLREMKNNFKG